MRRLYEFDSFHLDAINRLLTCEGKPVTLSSKAFDILLVLVENRGRVVEKKEMMKAVWADSYVEEVNLNVQICQLRKALGDDPTTHRFIITVPKRGFSFVANVVEVSDQDGTTGKEIDYQNDAENSVGEDETVPREEKASLSSIFSGRLSVKFSPARIALSASLLAGLLTLAYFVVSNKPARSNNSPAITSIAVLPFKAMDPEEEHLELGMADSMITRLSRLDKFDVRPTSAIFVYSGHSYDPVAAGRELGVDAVLQGTIQKVGQRVRVTVQLIKVADGRLVWAERFEEHSTSIFAVQDSIAEQVTAEMSLKLNADQREHLAKHYTENPEAFEAYSRGIHYWGKKTLDALKNSVEYFQRAIDIDPNYALAYIGLADSKAYIGLEEMDVSRREKLYQEALAAVMKALEIDESLAEAHATLGFIRSEYGGGWEAAEKEYKRAIELNPRYATPRHRYGYLLFSAGQINRAVQELQQAAQIDPTSAPISTTLGNALYLAGQSSEAIAQLRKVLEFDPDFHIARLRLGQAYEQSRMYDQAIEQFRKLAEIEKGDKLVLASLGHAYARSGRTSEARKVLKGLQNPPLQDGETLYCLALIYAGLEEKDKALASLREAVRIKPFPIYPLRFDPRLAALREDPGFEEVLRLRQAQLSQY